MTALGGEGEMMGTRLGQHFLVAPHAEARIDACEPVADRRVLEIGPGRGVLTAALLEAGAVMTAIEYDRLLVEQLEVPSTTPSPTARSSSFKATRFDAPGPSSS